MLLEGYQNPWEQEEDVGNSRKQGSPEGNQEAGHTQCACAEQPGWGAATAAAAATAAVRILTLKIP